MLPLRATGEGASGSLPASGDGGCPCCSLAHRRNYSSLCLHCHVAFSLCHPSLHPNFLLFIRTLSLDLGPPPPPIQLDHILTCLHQQRPSFQIESHSQVWGRGERAQVLVLDRVFFGDIILPLTGMKALNSHSHWVKLCLGACVNLKLCEFSHPLFP